MRMPMADTMQIWCCGTPAPASPVELSVPAHPARFVRREGMSRTPASDAPMPLHAAVQVYFPHGGVTKSTLLAAIKRGGLAYEKIGNAYFVTGADIQHWRATECRAAANPQGCNTAPQKTDGSLSMAERRSTRDAALASVRALKHSSATTSRAIARSTPGSVIPLKSRVRT